MKLKHLKIKTIFVSCSALFMLACSEQTATQNSKLPMDSVSASIDSSCTERGDFDDLSSDSLNGIYFQDLSIFLPEFHFSFLHPYAHPFEGDSLEIEANLGENFEGQKLLMSSEVFNITSIEQRYETSISIQAEGPHCDLNDWAHFYSEWQTVQKNHLEEYFMNTYTPKEAEIFPSFPMEAIRKAVQVQCGAEWVKPIQSVQSPNEYPSSVGISKYFLRINATRIDNGQSVQKIIVIVSPMGC